MAKMQRTWTVNDGGVMVCHYMDEIIFEFHISEVFNDYNDMTLTQKSCCYYGVKQILSDYHDVDGSSTNDTLKTMAKMLIDGKVDKTKRVKKSSKVEATAIINAYHNADDKTVKAMFKKLLDEQGIYIPE